MHSFILIINLYRSFSLVRFLSTNYIRTRYHSIIYISPCLTNVDIVVSRSNKTKVDYDTSVTHTTTTSRYDVLFASQFVRKPRIYIITWIMFIETEHSPVKPVPKHSVLSDTYRHTKTIAHQDPLHHNQDQVDSFDAVGLFRMETWNCYSLKTVTTGKSVSYLQLKTFSREEPSPEPSL